MKSVRMARVQDPQFCGIHLTAQHIVKKYLRPIAESKAPPRTSADGASAFSAALRGLLRGLVLPRRIR